MLGPRRLADADPRRALAASRSAKTAGSSPTSARARSASSAAVAHSPQPGHQLDVAVNSPVRKQATVLRYIPDPPPQRDRVELRRIDSSTEPVPASGSTRRLKQRRSVVLPEPLSPMRATHSSTRTRSRRARAPKRRRSAWRHAPPGAHTPAGSSHQARVAPQLSSQSTRVERGSDAL